MKKIAVLLLVTLAAAVATAGTVSHGLQRQLGLMSGDQEIRVLVVLEKQADIRALDWELRDAKADRDSRHRAVLAELHAVTATQAALLADLESAKSGGRVRGFTPHWLLNSVVVVTTADGVADLAAHPDVAVVEADLQVELIEPVPSAKEMRDEGIGIAPGLVSVGARRVWDELAILGDGILIGILDTGVDGTHPALSPRWRGNTAPASESWLDAAGLGHATPTDLISHGTHVLGTILGRAPGDTIGVAPGAEWIATNVINMSSGEDFDNAVLASLEFMADPDGDPATTDDVPGIVHNSWGINENFDGSPAYVDCDSRWWDAIDAVEALGIVLTWSCGNEGNGSGTIRSPADRATTALNAFSIGSTAHSAPFDISWFSSRGPSGCGGPHAVKPEVVAPGSDIYSSVPGGGYDYKSGTSMAGPHVAGIVALMLQAAPGVDVLTVKQTLIDTAVDLGAPGEENTYGHGMVDAYAAVTAVLTGHAAVSGTVTDAGTGLPMPGATVTFAADGQATRTVVCDGDGAFLRLLPAGAWSATYDAFGYFPQTVALNVVADQPLDASWALTAAPAAVLSGLVLDAGGAPVPGAEISAPDTPLAPVVADGSGAYALSVPSGFTYRFLARADGHGGVERTASIHADRTLDFQLPALAVEDFETGDFGAFAWIHGGQTQWAVQSDQVFSGAFAAASGDVGHGQSAILSLTVDVLAASPVEFEYRVSSEAGYDFLRFLVDDVRIDQWSGTVDWAHFSHVLEPGPHVLTWRYIKDGSEDGGLDTAWLDRVILPALVPGDVSTGVSATAPAVPTLEAPAPNPFNPRTTLAFNVPAGGAEVRLDVYDLTGRLVKRLAAGEFPAGRRTVVWEGDGDDGRPVASGTYVCRLSGGGVAVSRAVTLVK